MRPLLLSPLALGLALAACGPVNRGLESVNQPVVSRTDYSLDLRTAGYGGLAGGEDARLAAWFDTLRLGYGDRITIDDPAGQAGRDARDAIAAVTAHYGLLLGGTAPTTSGAVAPGQLRVIVSRSVADVPGCPNWTRWSQPNTDASTDSNYGCATYGNLAAMVADPEDLIHGRSVGANGSTRAVNRALKAYNDLTASGTGGAVKADGVGGK